MSLRAAILRAILILLALTAATAVIGIFIPGTTFVWRIVGTGATAILLGAIGLRFAAMVERPSTQIAGLAGLVGCAVIGLIAGSLTMGVMDLLMPGFQEQWWLTLLLLVDATILVVVALALHGSARKTPAAICLAAVAVIALLLGLFAIWGTPLSEILVNRSVRLFWATMWFGTLGAFSLIGLRRPADLNAGFAMTICMVGVVAACVGAVLVGFSGERQWLDFVPTGALTANAIAFPVALWMLLELCRTPSRLLWIPLTSVAAATVAMGSIAVGEWTDSYDPLWERLIAASSIVGVCSVVATLVVSRVARSIAAPTTVAELSDAIDLRCPLCGLQQKLPIQRRVDSADAGSGSPTCGRCGLELRIVATIPRCGTCEQILLWSMTPDCPECGATIQARRSQSG